MNLALSNDIFDDYPEQVTHTLRSGHATCIKFNRKGDYFATGRANGAVIVWDVDTMGVARKLRGHAASVSSLSWSADGRYLLSACHGWMVILWDLQTGKQHRAVRFNAPAFMAELNPSNHLQFCACFFEDKSYLVDMTSRIPTRHVLLSVPARDSSSSSNNNNNNNEDGAVEVQETVEKKAKEAARHMVTAVTYIADGRYVLAGTSKGKLNVVDAATCEIVHSTSICNAMITGLQTTQSSRVLLINCKDRIIRTFRVPDFADPQLDTGSVAFELEHKFQDVVNRMSWNYTAFSATGEYVIASTYNSHELYLWERGMGSLVRILVGRTEEMGQIAWHPSRPMFAVLNLDGGVIYIWNVTISQKWSALAPDFVEVEENVEYQEREDEFDVYPQEDINKQRLEAEDEIIDILPEKWNAGAGGGDGDMTTATQHAAPFIMPVCFDVGETDSEEELVPVRPGTMRRKGSADEDATDGLEDRATGSGLPAVASVPAVPKKKARTRRR